MLVCEVCGMELTYEEVGDGIGLAVVCVECDAEHDPEKYEGD